MDNVGDWIYIVFLIVAGISGLFNAKNKQKHSKPVQQPKKEVVEEPETVLGKGFWDIFEETEEEQPEEKPRAKKTIADVPVESLQTPVVTPVQPMAEQAPSYNRVAQHTQTEDNPLTDFEFNNAVELRKAIIYAEILNRKY